MKKKFFGFDVFGKFPNQENRKDNKFANFHNKKIGLGISMFKFFNQTFKSKIQKFFISKRSNRKDIRDFF